MMVMSNQLVHGNVQAHTKCLSCHKPFTKQEFLDRCDYAFTHSRTSTVKEVHKNAYVCVSIWMHDNCRAQAELKGRKEIGEIING